MARKSSAAPVADQDELQDELNDLAAGDEESSSADAGDESAGEDAAAGQADSTDGSGASPSGAVSESVAAQAASKQSIRDLLAAKGLKVEGDDDEAALNNLVRLTRQAEAVQPYVSKVHEYVQNAEDFARYKAYQQQAAFQQTQQQQAQAKPWWNPPEFDRNWLKYVDQANGGFKEGTPLHIQEGVQKYVDYQNGFSQRFLENPAEALKPWADELKREWLQEAQQQFQHQQYQQQVSHELAQIGQQNPWMYQSDAEGQPIINPATGQKVMTDVGAQVIQYADSLLRQAPNMHWPLAVRSAIAQVKAGVYEPYIASLTNGQSAEQTNGAKKTKLLNGQANKTPSRRGSLNGVGDDNGPLQNENASLADIMRDELKKSGMDFSRLET